METDRSDPDYCATNTTNDVPLSDGTPTTARTEAAGSIPIAIVGMACRFSGNVTNPSQLWELCVSGREGWTPIPESRFDVKSLYHANHTKVGRSHVKGGYFLNEDISLFDAAFFNLAQDVASGLDPQARLLLETVYEATEDAGIPLRKLAGSNTSVYAGTFNKDYHEIQTKDAEVLSHAFLAGTGTALIANRISHFYDLQGPSMSIDTGCSAGMVAIHQGCQSIRTGESDISIVGAASILLSQDAFISASTIGAIGAEGRCFAWDDRAQGYGRGEGVAALILQPLDAALRSRNRVHAVIKETGVNQDGKTTTITSPSIDAQVKLIRECYERAGFELSDTGYVEAHMTGTAVGDPMEAEAIARTFGESREAHNPMAVGSVKTNIGHTEPVSGLAAIIKTAFALKHQVIPPNLNYIRTNPEIHLDLWHLRVPSVLTSWPKDKLLRASINNFGYGGTNTHAILEPAPVSTNSNGSYGNGNINGDHNEYSNGIGFGVARDVELSHVFLLSAKDSVACQNMMRRLASYLGQNQPHLADLAYTLSDRRSLFPWVTAIQAKSADELANRLLEPTRKPTSTFKVPRLGFVFNGQGAQWYAMGRELIDAYPVFGHGIHKADAILKEYGADWSLREELMRNEATTRVGDVQFSQPISVAVQLCLVDVLNSWGVRPTAVTSHSSGEIAAAYATKALSFKEALGVAYFRGELALKFQELLSLEGGMLAAAISAESAEKYVADVVEGKAVVACVNSPNSVTLSGDLAALNEVAARLDAEGIFARKLKVPMAYHSHHMEHISQDYGDKLKPILSPGKRRWSEDAALFFSPVTGGIITTPVTLDPEHWVRNMTQPVLFNQAFDSMSEEVDILIEIGAHSTLAGPIRQILKACCVELLYMSCLKRNTDAVVTMQELSCELLGRGCAIDVRAVNFPYGDEVHQFVPDLPLYPWNHTKSYWVESRISKEQRFKRFPPHELLGTPLNGSSGPMVTWRNFLRLGDLEWLRDHQIDGSVVFPGAGYISMAVDAVRLLTDPSEETTIAYKLRDIDIANALIIPEASSGVEVQMVLKPCSTTEYDHLGWYEFELCSLGSDSAWMQHCKGYVSAETSKESLKAGISDLTRQPEAPKESSFLTDDEPVDIEAFFAELRKRGIYHGAEFQNLIDSRATTNRAIANFAIAMGACKEHEYVLHPTTFDSILQASFSCLPKEIASHTMLLPRSIRTLSIPRNLSRKGGDKMQAFSEIVRSSKHGYTSDISVLSSSNAGTNPVFLQVQDFFVQAVPRRPDEALEGAGICSKIAWELDVLHDFPLDIRDSLAIRVSEHEAETKEKLIRASYHFIHDAVIELEGHCSESWQWHHRRFYSWMKDVIVRGKAGGLGPGSQKWAETSEDFKLMLIDEINTSNVAGKLTVRVGRNLARIIRGDVMPLELMMEGNLLNQFYMDDEAHKARSYKHLSTIMKMYAIKNPGANVLEIGGGTGGATTTVLEGFSARGDGIGTLLGHYTFTDISPGFFEAARSKFAAWSFLLDYKRLDIEVDPLEQGFTAGSYDLIVAASCLHATKSLYRTMGHVRKLLKPGGSLLLIEATADRFEGQLIFGTLPGWWLGEEPERQNSPNAPVDLWKRVLQDTGFTGVDLDIPDYEEPEFQSARVMLSRASTVIKGPISIVKPDQENEAASKWLSQLANAIQAQTGVVPSIVRLTDVNLYRETICIMTTEMVSPFVDGMTATAFANLQNLLIHSSGLLWLSCAGQVDSANPSFGATDGLIRTMRQEDASKRWIKLDFEHSEENSWTEDKIQHVLHVLQQSFNAAVDPSQVEWEYAVKESRLHVPRIFPDKAHNTLVRGLSTDPVLELQPFNQPGRPLIWETLTTGAAGIDPYFIDNQELVATSVPSGMVEVEAKAFGLNFYEVMVALGQLDEPLKGHECSGIVTALGPDTAQSGLKVGDKVSALARGRIASRGRMWWTSVIKLPDDISWETAAAFPAAYVTAYSSLVQIAKLQRGESVLVHAAAGGTGQAAIVIAQSIGAEVFATCSTTAKRDLLIEKYKIDANHIFSSRDNSFGPAIMAQTEGKGVDVVLNSLSGSLLIATWDCIARFGRFVDITKVDIESNRRLETRPFRRCATYTSFDLLQWTEYCGQHTQEALQACTNIVCRRGNTLPISPIVPYSISDMTTAMRQMQGGHHIGKLVLVPRKEDRVKVIARSPPILLDNDDATYLISGGMGDICRAIAEWMIIEKGARHVVLASRLASTHSAAPDLRQLAETAGCRLLIRDCDMSDENSLLKLVHECTADGLPTIRGVVNGAMVLDDTVMEHMTYEQWSNGVRPKIDSSRNIHKHLPGLSFYVMLSSVVGVAGHTSQANYAAGNTFQDALARHRTANGEPAVTIDLGAVRSVGYVAEREAGGDERLRARVENTGFGSVDIKSVLAIIEAAIRDPLRATLENSQIIVGPNFQGFPSESSIRNDRRFGTLRIASHQGLISGFVQKASSSTSTAALAKALNAAENLAQATRVLVHAIGTKLADIFSISSTEVDPDLPLARYGVDSLVAVELRSWLIASVKAKMSVFEVLRSRPLTEFAALVAGRSELLAVRGFVQRYGNSALADSAP